MNVTVDRRSFIRTAALAGAATVAATGMAGAALADEPPAVGRTACWRRSACGRCAWRSPRRFDLRPCRRRLARPRRGRVPTRRPRRHARGSRLDGHPRAHHRHRRGVHGRRRDRGRRHRRSRRRPFRHRGGRERHRGPGVRYLADARPGHRHHQLHGPEGERPRVAPRRTSTRSACRSPATCRSNRVNQAIMRTWAANSGADFDWWYEGAAQAGGLWRDHSPLAARGRLRPGRRRVVPAVLQPAGVHWCPKARSPASTEASPGPSNLLAQASIDAGAEFHFNTRARQLVRGEDNNTGCVTAVIAEDADGNYVKFLQRHPRRGSGDRRRRPRRPTLTQHSGARARPNSPRR